MKINRVGYLVALILVITLSCNLPAEVLPAPSATPAEPPPLVAIPTNTPPPTLAFTHTALPPSATPQPTLTITSLPPSATITPTLTETPTSTLTPPPTSTLTATSLPPTVTRTLTPTSANSPTPPPTLTVAARTKTSAPAPARPVVKAPYFYGSPDYDGIWDEWKSFTTELPLAAVVYGYGNWAGEDDLEGSYRAAWDEKYLYLAVKVNDDIYAQNDSGSNLYQGDSLEVLLDGNLLGDLYSNQLSADDVQIGISPGNPDVNGTREAYLWFPRSQAGTRSGVIIATARQEGVTRYEVAIPWSVLNVTASRGARFGFAVSVSDNDNPAENQQQTMISSAPGRVLVDPTTWLELRLE